MRGFSLVGLFLQADIVVWSTIVDKSVRLGASRREMAVLDAAARTGDCSGLTDGVGAQMLAAGQGRG